MAHNAAQPIVKGAQTLNLQQGYPYALFGMGDTDLTKSFNNAIKFSEVLQSYLLSSLANMLKNIAEQTQLTAQEMNNSLNNLINQMEQNKGNSSELAILQERFTTAQQGFSSRLQTLSSMKDQTTSTISDNNQDASNLFSGLKSITQILTAV